MGRLLFLLLLIVCIYYLGRTIFSPKPRASRGQPRVDKAPHETELVQDPCCHLYIPKTEALQRSIRGRTHYFCSSQCADKYEQG